MAIVANSRIPLNCFVRLGSPVLQVVALSARLDEISLLPAAQSKPIFGPFGPPGRPVCRPRGPLSPSNCAKIAGAGAPPPRTRARAPAPLHGALAGLRPARSPK
jgi:hypothetical protein